MYKKYAIVLPSFFSLLAVFLLIECCQQSIVKKYSDFFEADKREQPFRILPKIDNIGDKNGRCEHFGVPCAEAIRDFIERIEPGGAKGDVQLGYSISIPIFTMFTKEGEHWSFDQAGMDRLINLIKDVGRPVLFHISANHFSPNLAIVDEIKQDPDNLMEFSKGGVDVEKYFSTHVFPFTLSVDKSLTINRLRFEAIEKMSDALLKLHQEAPDLLHAVSLVGESYHLSSNIKDKMGAYFNNDFTDYSPHAIEKFKTWLKKRYASIEALNAEARTNFSDWENVKPPHLDFRSADIFDAWEHFDSFADGMLPIFGWAVCRDGVEPVINVYLDGKRIGGAVYGLNRLDVYRHNNKVDNPNTGFRFKLNYSVLQSGSYQVDVKVLCGSSAEQEFESVRLTVLDARTISTEDVRGNPTEEREVPKLINEVLMADLGFPRVELKLFYNPYAKLWQDFRGDMIENYFIAIWKAFIKNGFPEHKTYIAQMVPDLHGSWNQSQLATHKTLTKQSPYYPSLMLYGGLAINNKIANHVQGKPYGVSQFNPLMFKNEESAKQSIEFHHKNGASFISPYYMSINGKYNKNNAHSKMLISEDTPIIENKYFFEAIREAVRR